MWTAIVMVIAGGLYEVFLKKSLSLSSLPQRTFLLTGQTAGFLMTAGIVCFIPVHWEILRQPAYTAAIFSIAVLWFLSELFRQRAYSLERVSVLMPWSNLTPFLLISIGFLLFADTSIPSFLVALTAVTVLVISGFVDKKTGFTRKGGLLWYLGSLVFDVTEMLLSAWVVKTVPVTTFVVLALTIYYLQIVLISCHPKHWGSLKLQSGNFWRFRLTSSLLWYVYWFFEIFLYSELGIVVTTTLSFVQLSITLAASWLILKDRPRVRDIALSIFLVFAAFLGYALR